MAVFDKLARLGDRMSSSARRILADADAADDDHAVFDAAAAAPAAPTQRLDLPQAFRALGIDARTTLPAARAAYREKARPLIVVQTEGHADAAPAAERLALLEDALALVEEALLPLPKR